MTFSRFKNELQTIDKCTRIEIQQQLYDIVEI